MLRKLDMGGAGRGSAGSAMAIGHYQRGSLQYNLLLKILGRRHDADMDIDFDDVGRQKVTTW
jgi:hypothetical protein